MQFSKNNLLLVLSSLLILSYDLYDVNMYFNVFSYHILTSSGDKGIRTLDPLLARQVLSQLSYTPMDIVYLIN